MWQATRNSCQILISAKKTRSSLPWFILISNYVSPEIKEWSAWETPNSLWQQSAVSSNGSHKHPAHVTVGGGGIYKRRSGVATKGTPYRAPDNCTLPNNRKEKSFLVEMAWYACFWMLDCQTNSRMKQYWWQYIYKTDLSSKQLTALHMNYGMDQSQVSSTSKCLDAKPSFSVENVHSWTIMPVNEY